MVKVLFLDVDGVINVPRGMDRRLLLILKAVVEETQCKIVLSSDWRRTASSRNEIRSILKSCGMDYIACTPMSKPPFEARRPEEIVEWIQAHNSAVDQGKGELVGLGKVEEWVAIDDRPLLSEAGGSFLRGHFVRTNPATGFTAQRAQMASDILMGREAHNKGTTLEVSAADGTAGRAAHRTTPTAIVGAQRSRNSALGAAGRHASTPARLQRAGLAGRAPCGAALR